MIDTTGGDILTSSYSAPPSTAFFDSDIFSKFDDGNYGDTCEVHPSIETEKRVTVLL
jgi:hypothetical protein